jgi:hypothetical protein
MELVLLENSLIAQVKANLSLYLTAPEGVWVSGCVDPHFHDFGNSWKWVVILTHRPLYPNWQRPRYPLGRRFGGLQSGDNSWPYGDSNSNSSVVQPAASSYIDYAIPAQALKNYQRFMELHGLIPCSQESYTLYSKPDETKVAQSQNSYYIWSDLKVFTRYFNFWRRLIFYVFHIYHISQQKYFYVLDVQLKYLFM